MTEHQRPRRETVTRPTPKSPQRGPVGAGRDIDEQTTLGETYMRSLLRTQLRLGLSVLALVIIPLAILPMVWAIAPGIGRLTVGPVPLPWLVLGIGVYPLLVLAGWRYVRQAERNESEFVRIVTRQ